MFVARIQNSSAFGGVTLVKVLLFLGADHSLKCKVTCRAVEFIYFTSPSQETGRLLQGVSARQVQDA